MSRVLALCLFLAVAVAWSQPAYAAPGTVSGTVTRAATSTPIAGVILYLCNASYTCAYATTDASGVFTFTIDPGTYFLFSHNDQGFVNEIYDNIQCPGDCDIYQAITTGTAVVVTSGGSVSGRNFALADGGSISGSVTHAITSAAVPNVEMIIYTRVGGYLTYAGYGYTDAAGVYTLRGFPSGTYYVLTRNAAGLVNEVFDNVSCPGQCNNSTIELGTPITVTSGVVTPNINFVLAPGGSVTGTVRDNATSTPIQSVYVSLVSATGVTGGTSWTNALGAYTISGLPSGTYYAYTYNTVGYVNEYYDNQSCLGNCGSTPPSTATPIVVTSPAATTGKDFALDQGGTISGTITNSVTSAAVSGVTVYAYVPTGDGSYRYAGAATTNGTGAYTVKGLATATYILYTNNNLALINEVFNNVQCLGSCYTSYFPSATGVAVMAGGAVSGRDFALQPGGLIRGTVLSASGSTPIPNTDVYLYSRDSFGDPRYIESATADGTGAYEFDGLMTGAYYVYTLARGYMGEMYSGVQCPGYCFSPAGAGTPIAVTAGQTTGNINFSLQRGGGISGIVRDAAGSTPLKDVWVYAYSSLGTGEVLTMGWAQTDSAGAYTIGGLITGDYFLSTAITAFDDQIYGGIVCPGYCSPDLTVANGTPVHVTGATTTSAIDFTLNAVAGRISGVVTNAASTAPIASIYIYAYTRVGTGYQYAAYGYTDASGNYQINNLPAGTYYLVTRTYGKFLDEIHNDVRCLTTCGSGVAVVSRGAGVTVAAGTVTVNFALDPMPAVAPGPPEWPYGRVSGGTIRLEWWDSRLGGAPTDYILEVGLSPGATLLSIPVSGTTYERPGVPPGHYYFRVRGRNSSGIGPASAEFDLTVNADGTGAPGEPYDLMGYVEGNRLFMNWYEPWTGGYPSAYIFEVGTAPGLSNIGSFAAGSRTHFELSPAPPPGVYFVRVRGRNALSVGRPSSDLMLVVGGVPSPPEGPGSLSAAVDASGRVTVGWNKPRGPVTGYVLEIGTMSEQYNLGAIIVPATNSIVTPGAVPPGTYFLRIRAINASGVGPASDEHVLVVR